MEKQLFEFSFEGNSFQEIFDMSLDAVSNLAGKWTPVMTDIVNNDKDYTFETNNDGEEMVGVRVGKILERFLATATNDRERLFVIMSFTRLEQFIIKKIEHKCRMREFNDVLNNIGK